MRPARVPLFLHLVAVAVALSAFLPGQTITFSNQWPLFESLRTTASIIFAILGGWIAVVYPNALKKVLTLTRVERDGEMLKLANLMRAMFFATFTLMIVVILGPMAPVLKQYSFIMQYSTFLRGSTFSLLVYLSLMQIWTLLLSVAPAELLNREVRKDFGHRDKVEEFKRTHVG